MVSTLIQILVGIGLVAMFVAFVRTATPPGGAGAILDPDDPKQVGFLVGMLGGSVQDAFVVQTALRDFESKNGRKATMSDIAYIQSMLQSMLK